MRVPFALGWVLLVAAFLGASLETVARVYSKSTSLVLSAYDTWYTLWPGSLVVSQALVERYLHWTVWEFLAVPILALPPWAMFGLPGGALAWYFRPRRSRVDELEEGSFYLYDDLARAARQMAKDEGYDGSEDDLAPDHGPAKDYGAGLDDDRAAESFPDLERRSRP